MAAPRLRAHWLREMGYRPLVLRRPLPGPPGDPPPALAQTAPADGTDIDAATAGTASMAWASEAPVDPLWQGLLQACHAGPADAEGLGWKQTMQDRAFAFVGAELHINLSLLRREPRAKRALWRTLRALRRQRQASP